MLFVFILHQKHLQFQQFMKKHLRVKISFRPKLLEELKTSEIELVKEQQLIIGKFGHDNILQIVK